MSVADRGPMRVLHVVGGKGMRRGGIETWLMRVLRAIDRERFQLDFLVPTIEPAAYDEEIRALGGRVLAGVSHRRPLRYQRTLRRVLRTCGPYRVVHSHVAHVSGLVLQVARAEGVPVRIAHSHNDRRGAYTEAGILKRAYFAYTRGLIFRHATAGLACSTSAAEWLFGPNWTSDPRWRVLRYGLDLAPFAATVDRRQRRAELGLSDQDIVFGHVGNFRPQKNHAFLVRIAAETVRMQPRARFVLIGCDMDDAAGLRSAIQQQATAAGLGEKVLFLGERSDVPELMLGVMDAFVMPSLYEGLPIAALEAQAAGLRCVISDVVTREVEVVPGLVRFLGLEESPSRWAEALLQAAAEGAGPARDEARARVRESWLNIRSGVARLEALYGG